MSNHLYSRIVLALLLTLSFTAHAKDKAPQPAVPKEWPKWLQKAMKKETRIKKTQAVNLGDGQFASKIVGKLDAQPEAFEGGWYLSTDIGAELPVQCWVFNEPRNFANQLESLHEALLEGAVEANDNAPLKEQLPYYVHSDVHGGTPFLASEWLYTLGEAPSLKIGLSKARVAVKDGATIACAHLELGYRKSFARVFDSLLSNAVVALPGEDPYYTEVVKLSMSGKAAGVATARFSLDEDGDTRIDMMTSMLMQIDDRSLLASDSSKLEYSRPDGTLINAFDTTVQNGEAKNDMALARDDEGVWKVDGTLSGKQISAGVDVVDDREPLSALGQMLMFRAAVNDDASAPIGFPMWISEANPTLFMSGSIEVTKRGKKSHEAEVQLGPLKMNARFDNGGSMLDGTMFMGPNEIVMERVAVTGSVPDRADD